MNIWIDEQQPGARWVVHLDAECVSFACFDDAQAFTKTLQTRIQAPHAWPMGDGRSGAGSGATQVAQVAPRRSHAVVSG